MNKFKKVLAGASAACLMVCAAGSIAACGAPEHTHDWGDWTEKTAADCTHAQVLQRNCKDTNCPEGGHEEKTGTAALNHGWSSWTEKTAANCTHAKVEERNCTRTGCAGHEERDVGEALGHELGEWTVVNPTAAATGTADNVCTREGCNGDIHVELPVLSSEKYEKGEDNATCVENGTQTYTFKCDDGDITFDVETAKLPHTLVWNVETAPTDNEKGLAKAACTGDGCDEGDLAELPELSFGNVVNGFYDADRVEGENGARGKWVYTVTKEKADELFGGKRFSFDLLDLPALEYGDNEVTLVAYENAEYEFTAPEAKVYSVKAPEGVTVNVNGVDIVKGTKTAANFETAVGENVRIIIASDTSQTVTVTIGEPVDETPAIAVGEPTLVVVDANPDGSAKMFTLKVAEGVTEAKHNVTIQMPGASAFCYFAVCSEGETITYEEITSSKGVMFMGNMGAVRESGKYTAAEASGTSFDTIKIGVTLKAGDVIYITTKSGIDINLTVTLN